MQATSTSDALCVAATSICGSGFEAFYASFSSAVILWIVF
jgi:hypothetical protein